MSCSQGSLQIAILKRIELLSGAYHVLKDWLVPVLYVSGWKLTICFGSSYFIQQNTFLFFLGHSSVAATHSHIFVYSAFRGICPRKQATFSRSYSSREFSWSPLSKPLTKMEVSAFRKYKIISSPKDREDMPTANLEGMHETVNLDVNKTIFLWFYFFFALFSSP